MIVVPATDTDVTFAVLVKRRSGCRAVAVVVVPDPLTVPPPAGVPVAVAVFATVPASRSACVSAWVALHAIVEPGRRTATGDAGLHDPSTALASLTAVLKIDTFPALTTVIV